MLKLLKTNKLIRSSLQLILGNRTVCRPFKNSELKLYFPSGKYLGFYFSKYASFEDVITQNLQKVIFPGNTVFDIGANIGYYTIQFSKWVKTGKVYAFEPDPGNLKHLRDNIDKNRISNTVVINKAVSNNNGVAEFYQDLNTGRTSGLIKDVFHPKGIFKPVKITVDVIKIDDVITTSARPDVIKCDIEGNEYNFLEGAAKLVRETLPVMMIEVVEKNWVSVYQFLNNAGYLLYDASKPLNSNAISLGSGMFIENIFAITKQKFDDLFNK